MALAFGYERYLRSFYGRGWLPPPRVVFFWERAKAEGSDSSMPERYSNTLKKGRGDISRDYTRRDLGVGEKGCSRLTVMRAGPDAVRWKGSGPVERGREGATSRGQLKGGERGRAPSRSSGSRVDEGFVNNRAAIRRPGETRTHVDSGQGALPLLPFFVEPPLHHRLHLFLYQHPPSPSSLIFLLLLPFLLRILLTTTTSSFTSSLASPAASFLPLPPQRGRGRNILDVYVPRGIEGGYLHTITGGYR